MIPRNLLDLSPVARLRRRCNAAVYIYYLLWSMVGAILLAGVIMLAGKTFSQTLTSNIHWLALLIPVVSIIAYVIARREFIDEERLIAIADDRFHADGLLITAAEIELGPWNERLRKRAEEEAAHPSLPKWNINFMLSRLAPCFAFLLVTTLIPQRIPSPDSLADLRNFVVSELERTLDELDEAGLLDPARRDQFAERIQEMRDEMERPFSAADWEAADAVREMMRAEAQRRSEELMAALELAQQAMELLDSADAETGGEFDQMELARRTEEAADALERALSRVGDRRAVEELTRRFREAQEGEEGEPGDGEWRMPRNTKQLKLTAEELARLMEELVGAPKLGMTRDDGEEGASPEGGIPGGQEGEFAIDDGTERDEPGAPGWGGISRGPGEAPMIWGDEGPRVELFNEMKLPPGYIVNPEGVVIRVMAVEPDDDPIAGEPGAQRDFDEEAGLPGADRRLAPRHRGVIRRYFEGNN